MYKDLIFYLCLILATLHIVFQIYGKHFGVYTEFSTKAVIFLIIQRFSI